MLHDNKDYLDQQELDVLASFYSHGFVGLIKEWIENSCVHPSELMSDIVKHQIHGKFKI